MTNLFQQEHYPYMVQASREVLHQGFPKNWEEFSEQDIFDYCEGNCIEADEGDDGEFLFERISVAAKLILEARNDEDNRKSIIANHLASQISELGFAVMIFSDTELNGVDPDLIEAAMQTAGEEQIDYEKTGMEG